MHAKRLEGVLGGTQALFRGLQLPVEDAREFRQLRALELSRDGDIALGHRVEGSGDRDRVSPRKLEPHEVAIQIHGRLKVALHLRGRVARREDREVDRTIGAERVKWRTPHEPDAHPNRVSSRGALEPAAAARRERDGLPCVVDGEAIWPWPEP